MTAQELDIFAGLDDEPDRHYIDLKETDPIDAELSDDHLMQEFEALKEFLMAGGATDPEGVFHKADADTVAEAENSYTFVQAELHARGLIEIDDAAPGISDSVRPCDGTDYDKLLDGLVHGAVFVSYTDAEEWLQAKLATYGTSATEMTWESYFAVEKLIGELVKAGQAANTTKSRSRKKSGSAKSAGSPNLPASASPAQIVEEILETVNPVEKLPIPPANPPRLVDENGEVCDLPAALRLISETDPILSSDPRAPEVIDKILQKLKQWQHQIDDWEVQHSRRIKPLKDKITWFNQEFGAFIDIVTKNQIRLHHTSQSGKSKGKLTKKYWDYPSGRVSYSVTGGAEIWEQGQYHDFIKMLGDIRARHDRADATDEDIAKFVELEGKFIEIYDVMKTVYEVPKTAVLKLVEEKKLPVPGVKVTPEDDLGSKRKIEGVSL